MDTNTDNFVMNSRALARALFKNAPDAIVVTDASDTIQMVNPAFEILFGYSAEQIIGSKSRLLYADEDQFDQIHGSCPDEASAGDTAFYEYDIVFLISGGESLSAQAVAGTIRDDDGELTGRITFIRDTSKQKNQQTILKQREHELTSIIENLPLMLYLKNVRDLRLVYINRAGERLLGHSSDWLLGKTVHDLLPPAQADNVTASDRDVIASGDPHEIDEEIIRTPHGDRVFRTRKAVIWCDKGLPVYLLGLSEDITERKQAREQLQRSREQLEDIANSIPGGLYQFLVNKDGRVSFSYISDGLRKIFDLPTDGDITNPDTLADRIEPADLPAIQESIRAAIAGPGPWAAEFRVRTADSIRWLHGHARPRQQADGSILFNGVITDVSERHRMEERLLAEREQILDRDRWKQQELPRLCDEQQTAIDELLEYLQRNQRLSDDELASHIEAITQTCRKLSTRIADMLALNRGNDTVNDATVAACRHTHTTLATKATVLYIEDNPANLRLIQKSLSTDQDFDLYSATTPAEGLEQARRLQPDVILLDINLPGMDGYALLNALQAEPDLAEKPVIAVTAQAMPWDIEKGRQAGFFAYLTKPIEISTLRQTLYNALQS